MLKDKPESLDLDGVSPLEVKKRLLLRLDNLMKTTIPRLQQAQVKCKADFDRRMRLTHPHIRSGQWVFIERETKLRNEDGTRQEGKLYPKALGPYEVLEKGTHVVVLEVDGLRESIFLDRVTVAPTTSGVIIASPATP